MNMNRREFIALASTGLGFSAASLKALADAKGGITEKDLLKEGQVANVANYCENPTKQPNKFCPDVKGNCASCMFYNQDGKSETTFKGKKVAMCTVLGTDASKPRYVLATASCATFAPRPK